MLMAVLEGLAVDRKPHGHALEDALHRLPRSHREEVAFRKGGLHCGNNLCTHDSFGLWRMAHLQIAVFFRFSRLEMRGSAGSRPKRILVYQRSFQLSSFFSDLVRKMRKHRKAPIASTPAPGGNSESR